MRKIFFVILMLMAAASTGLIMIAPTNDALARGGGGNGGGNGGGPCVGPNCGPPPAWPPGHPCVGGGPNCGPGQLDELIECLCGASGGGERRACDGYRPVKIEEFCEGR